MTKCAYAMLMVVVLGLSAGSIPAMAAQNGFGDTVVANSFPVRNLSAFGPEDADAMVASNTDAARLSSIVPAAGEAAAPRSKIGVKTGTALYGPFRSGDMQHTLAK